MNARTHNRITYADIAVGVLFSVSVAGAVYCVLAALGSW